MENQSDEAVKTRSMFLSPNVEEAGVQVVADGQLLACETECYALSYNTQIGVEEWRYAVLTDVGESSQVGKPMVEAILFDLKFEPRETYDVIVSYRYRLGGYPEYDFNVKCGELHYYRHFGSDVEWFRGSYHQPDFGEGYARAGKQQPEG